MSIVRVIASSAEVENAVDSDILSLLEDELHVLDDRANGREN